MGCYHSSCSSIAEIVKPPGNSKKTVYSFITGSVTTSTIAHILLLYPPLEGATISLFYIKFKSDMVCLEPPTEGRIALTAYFLPGLADWFLDVRRKRYLLSTRRRIQVLLTVHWKVTASFSKQNPICYPVQKISSKCNPPRTSFFSPFPCYSSLGSSQSIRNAKAEKEVKETIFSHFDVSFLS